MSSVNLAIITGRLGRDPELTTTTNGTTITKMSIATNHRRAGEEQTQWHRVVLFGQPAEFAAQYGRKGRLAHVEGRIQTNSWEDRDGNKRETTEIIAHVCKFLDKYMEKPDTTTRDNAEAADVRRPPLSDIPF